MSEDTTKQAAAVPAAAPVVPDYLKAYVNKQQGEADSMASSSVSIPRVSLRGKKFRLNLAGEEVKTFNDFMDCIILGVTPDAGRFIKTFYIKAYTGGGDNSPPDCASDDGVRPSPWISAPQSMSCQTCEKNRFGSATSRLGKPSKACKDSKRLWIAMPDDVAGTVYALQVPVTSLKALSDYGRDIKNMGGTPISAIITRILMDDDSEFPEISFRANGFLPQEQGLLAMSRNETKDWMLTSVSGGPALDAPKPQVALPGAAQTAAATPAAGAAAGPGPTPGQSQANVGEALKTW
jgi:hypothetical protein